MIIARLAIEGPVLIVPRVFEDKRGAFFESYSRKTYRDAIGDIAFVQDNHAYSAKKGTIRGLHFQAPPKAQAKLVHVVRGAILDVAVDLRLGSPTYLRNVAVELSAAARNQLFCPVGFAHGYCTLEDETEVSYKVDNDFSPENDRALRWSDPALGIDWRFDPRAMIASDRDNQAPLAAEIETPFRYGGG